jgi:hypothetical protein
MYRVWEQKNGALLKWELGYRDDVPNMMANLVQVFVPLPPKSPSRRRTLPPRPFAYLGGGTPTGPPRLVQETG